MEEKSKIPWWQPGLVLFTRLSAWIAIPVVIAVIIGKYLDRVFHSQPWLMLASVSISFVVSIVMLVRIGLKEITASEKAEKPIIKKQ
ncbi:MAG TPA: hypothetical protein DDY21_01445 [Candidatus Moranbacteria bacterium]|nr:hypothetical protein [Candidatus Moranbacteria bacterium]HCO99469.1 hypothetical protein [Candidatus Moranbacteria bacterium]